MKYGFICHYSRLLAQKEVLQERGGEKTKVGLFSVRSREPYGVAPPLSEGVLLMFTAGPFRMSSGATAVCCVLCVITEEVSAWAP